MRSLLLVALVLLPVLVVAAPAPPDPFVEYQPDGFSFELRMVGDEYALHQETLDGYSVLKGDNGWWFYAAGLKNGNLVPSSMRVGFGNPASLGVKKHLHPALRDPAGRDFKEAIDQLGLRFGPATDGPLNLGSGTQAIVFMIDFSDIPHNSANTSVTYDDLLFTGTNSMQDFFLENSYNQFTVTGSVYSSWLALDSTKLFYETNLWQLLIPDIVAEANALGVNWADYDYDNDQVVDHLIIVSAGGCLTTGIWPHRSYDSTGVDTGDGVTIKSYTLQSEDCPLGVFAHEFSHDLARPIGNPELYDLDSGVTTATDDNDYPLQDWCLMSDSGLWAGATTATRGDLPNHLSGFLKWYDGWVTPTTVATTGPQSLAPVETNAALIKLATTPTEYFLLEYRHPTAGTFDRYNSHETSGNYSPLDCGLLITHVDESQPDGPGEFNDGTPNNLYYGVTVEDPAFVGYGVSDSRPETCNEELRWGAAYTSDDPQGQTDFTPATSPSSTRNDGVASGYSVTQVGTCGAGSISFSVTAAGSLPAEVLPSPTPLTVARSEAGGAPFDFIKDDGVFESAYPSSSGSRLCWVEGFTPSSYPISITDIKLLVNSFSNISPGHPIELLLYLDPDGSGSPNGGNTTLAYSEYTTVQVISDTVWNTWTLNSPVRITAGDFYVGVYDYDHQTAGTNLYASIDTTTAGSLYFQTGGTSPGSFGTVGISGVWMIRAVGAELAGPDDVVVSWGAACNVGQIPDQDYAVYGGSLASLHSGYSFESLVCTTGGALTQDVSYPGNAYFLVAPVYLGFEGNLGHSRPEASVPCFERNAISCPGD